MISVCFLCVVCLPACMMWHATRCRHRAANLTYFAVRVLTERRCKDVDMTIKRTNYFIFV